MSQFQSFLAGYQAQLASARSAEELGLRKAELGNSRAGRIALEQFRNRQLQQQAQYQQGQLEQGEAELAERTATREEGVRQFDAEAPIRDAEVLERTARAAMYGKQGDAAAAAALADNGRRDFDLGGLIRAVEENDFTGLDLSNVPAGAITQALGLMRDIREQKNPPLPANLRYLTGLDDQQLTGIASGMSQYANSGGITDPEDIKGMEIAGAAQMILNQRRNESQGRNIRTAQSTDAAYDQWSGALNTLRDSMPSAQLADWIESQVEAGVLPREYVERYFSSSN